PGNIRELQSILKQALLRASGPVLLHTFLPVLPDEPSETAAGHYSVRRPAADESHNLEAFIKHQLSSECRDLYAEAHGHLDRILLARVLEFTGGNQHQAARLLGIARQTLRIKLRDRGLHVAHSVEADEDSQS